jgi:hypothetical protein
MVTDKEIYNTTLFKYRLGIVLIWMGVLTWLPFLVLRIAGERPSLFWYLPFHLVGVIGGSRLRAAARREMNLVPPKKNLFQLLGHGMILAGILVWAPYFYLRAVVHQPVEVMDYLPYHLAGILGGISLLGFSYLISRRSEKQL